MTNYYLHCEVFLALNKGNNAVTSLYSVEFFNVDQEARKYFQKGYHTKLDRPLNYKCPEDHQHATEIKTKYHFKTKDRVFYFGYDIKIDDIKRITLSYSL